MNVAARVSGAVGAALERRTSRRGILARAALAGSALAVAPVRYLVRPDPAWAVIGPGGCGSGAKCNDGYTAFCCEVERGLNTCPENTYIAGWWKCTDYKGSGLCHGQGFRYYLDCNRIPGRTYPGGCQCAGGDCGKRRIDCNHFRYGQCNAQVSGQTEVVCRLVICQHPGTVPGLNCNSTEMVDNRTCSHEARCLQGLAVPLPGEGSLMVAIVSVETVLLVVLLVLVAGLLRSNAEILRRLGSPGEPRDTGGTVPTPPAAPARPPGAPAAPLAGPTPAGDAVALDFDSAGAGPTLLAFLTSGCATCAGFWETLGEPRLPTGVRTVVVTHGGERERPTRLRKLSPPGIPVVMSSQAWLDYSVPGAPYFVLVDGSIRGEGAATSWAALSSLVGDAIEDARDSGGTARALRVDRALEAAGIGPDHPSLYPGSPASEP